MHPGERVNGKSFSWFWKYCLMPWFQFNIRFLKAGVENFSWFLRIQRMQWRKVVLEILTNFHILGLYGPEFYSYSTAINEPILPRDLNATEKSNNEIEKADTLLKLDSRDDLQDMLYCNVIAHYRHQGGARPEYSRAFFSICQGPGDHGRGVQCQVVRKAACK